MTKRRFALRHLFGGAVLLSVALIGAVALGSAPPSATVPTTVAFSARLSEDDAPADGPVDLTFRLYDRATGGSALWQEEHLGVTVEEGFVSVQLGADTALDATLFDGGARFVEVDVAGTTLEPRIAIASVPYALRADKADEAARLGSLGASDVQRRVDDTCSSGTFMTGVNDDGSVACDSADVDTSGLQSRVTGSCSAGQQIRQINADGTVVCDASTSTGTFASQANNRCGWQVTTCGTEQCTSNCPSGYHVEGGGCDVTNPGTMIESYPGSTGNFPPDGFNAVSVFNIWVCRVSSGGGNVQSAHAFCCTN